MKFKIMILIAFLATLSLTVIAEELETIYLATDNNIWIFNIDEQTFESVVAVNENSVLGQILVDRNDTYVFYIEYNTEVNKLYRYDIQADESELLFEHPDLTLISPSVGDVVFIGLINKKSPELSSVCLLIIGSVDCNTVEIIINFDSFFWLNDTTFATFVDKHIQIFQVDSVDELSVGILDEISLGDLWYTTTSKSDTSILFAATDVEQSLYTFDITSHEITELSNIEVSDIKAAINKIKVSPDGKLIAYQLANYLFVVDTLSGETVYELDNILSIEWASNDNLVILTEGEEAELYDLSVTNLLTNTLSNPIPIPVKTVSVSFSK